MLLKSYLIIACFLLTLKHSLDSKDGKNYLCAKIKYLHARCTLHQVTGYLLFRTGLWVSLRMRIESNTTAFSLCFCWQENIIFKISMEGFILLGKTFQILNYLLGITHWQTVNSITISANFNSNA